MGDLLGYSGIATKIKAMSSKLFTMEDYEKLSECTDISDIVAYLKGNMAYDHVLGSENEEHIRRYNLEKYIRDTILYDYNKIYKFSSAVQRKYLKVYFMRFEIGFIKKHIRRCFSTHKSAIVTDLGGNDIFDRKCCFDRQAVAGADTIDELIGTMASTVYYKPLRLVEGKADAGLFDYETVLDILFFRTLWKTCSKVLGKSDMRIIRKVYGEEIDLINLQWIYRAKKYYRLTDVQMYSMVIPEFYRIRKQDMIYLVKTETVAEFMDMLKKLPYTRKLSDIENINLEDLYEEHMDKLYMDIARKNPYSIACIDSYFYKKEKEIGNLIRITEHVRYGLDKDNIMKSVKI